MTFYWVSDQKMDLRRRGADSWRGAIHTIFRLLLSLEEVSDRSLETNNNTIYIYISLQC